MTTNILTLTIEKLELSGLQSCILQFLKEKDGSYNFPSHGRATTLTELTDPDDMQENVLYLVTVSGLGMNKSFYSIKYKDDEDTDGLGKIFYVSVENKLVENKFRDRIYIVEFFSTPFSYNSGTISTQATGAPYQFSQLLEDLGVVDPGEEP
jgi:hypothetical protein